MCDAVIGRGRAAPVAAAAAPTAGQAADGGGVTVPAATGASVRARAIAAAVGLFALALAVRVAVALGHPDPGYPDGAYYIDVARSLAAGHGFSVDFVWTFIEVGGRIPAHAVLPVPSNPHWAPLASIVQVPFLLAFGSGIWASLAPFLLTGALAAPLTWAIARDAGASGRVQVAAGLLAAVPAMTTAYIAQPDNFPITTVLGGASLWLAARGLRGDGRSFALSGLLVGLATLARTDGILLAAGPAAAFGWSRWRAWHEDRATPAGPRRTHAVAAGSPDAGATARRAIPFRAAVACAALFLVVVGPWWIRQVAVFGSVSPSTGAGILWLRSFSELNSVTADRSLGTFLAQPLGDLVGSRAAALGQEVTTFVVIVCAGVLVPFVVVGAWRRRHSGDFGPWAVAALALVVVATLLFAIHVPNGMFLHAGVAFAPHAYVLAAEGVAASAAWAWRRRPAPGRHRIEGWALTVVVAVVAASAALATAVVQRGWEQVRVDRVELAAALDRIGVQPDDRLMTQDAAGFRYITGRPGIVSPDDPLPVVEQAARAYGIRWLVVERDGAVASLAPLLDGGARPSWIGPPAFVLSARADRAGAGTDTTRAAGPPAAAIYPVCFDASDARCAAGQP